MPSSLVLVSRRMKASTVIPVPKFNPVVPADDMNPVEPSKSTPLPSTAETWLRVPESVPA